MGIFHMKVLQPGSPAALWFGFKADEFAVDSYLWVQGNNVYVPFIASERPGEGNVTRLFKSINDRGFTVIVPIPFPKMEEILRHLGFEQGLDYSFEHQKHVEVWIRDPQEGVVPTEPDELLAGFVSHPRSPWVRTRHGYSMIGSQEQMKQLMGEVLGTNGSQRRST